ncbi:YeiH family protein [Paenibacillus terreus]|uniref:YeiH family protein n=1 Tax=Paenibacillus terreus TaxID=1387834 RepID=A0ABV5BDA7_9BACL
MSGQQQGVVGGSRKQQSKSLSFGLWIAGLLFTLIIALIGWGLSMLPVLDHVGPMACAILLAVAYRQIWGYPLAMRCGIQFSSKKLLRLAIILYGLKLNIEVVLRQGLGLLARDIGVVVLAITVTVLLAKWLKAEPSLSLLLGIGTGVCGAAAIAAVSPIVKAKDEDTAIGVGIIALVGTIFAVMYAILRPILPLTATQYGIWSGISLHELAQVALAAAPAGQDALAMALLAKLGRVFLIVPLCFILIFWMKRKGAPHMADKQIEFPWFLAGFLVMSIIGTYVLGKHVAVSAAVLNGVSNVTSFILTMAMTGLGLNVNLQDLRTRALRPLIAMVIASVLLSVVAFFIS